MGATASLYSSLTYQFVNTNSSGVLGSRKDKLPREKLDSEKITKKDHQNINNLAFSTTRQADSRKMEQSVEERACQ